MCKEAPHHLHTPLLHLPTSRACSFAAVPTPEVTFCKTCCTMEHPSVLNLSFWTRAQCCLAIGKFPLHLTVEERSCKYVS